MNPSSTGGTAQGARQPDPALERLGLGERICDEAGRRRVFRPAFGVRALRHSAAATMIHAGASP